MAQGWDESVFMGLEALDHDGEARVRALGRLEPEADEPYEVPRALPVFEELDLEVAPRLA